MCFWWLNQELEVLYVMLCRAEADNKSMKNIDEIKESSYIAYLDENNLYGFALSQNLQRSGSW